MCKHGHVCAGFGATQRFSDAELLYLMRSLAGLHFVNVVLLALGLLSWAEDVIDTSSDRLADIKNTSEKKWARRSST